MMNLSADRASALLSARADRILDPELKVNYVANVQHLKYFFTSGYMLENEYAALLDRELAEVALSHSRRVVEAKSCRC
jgi:hypothetical protein